MTSGSPQPGNPLTSTAEKLRQELDRWLEIAWSQGERALDAFGLRGGGRAWTPNVDVVESTDEIRVFVDLPGIAPQSVNVTLSGNLLIIEGERPVVPASEGELVHMAERPKGAFRRSLPMPIPIDAEHVTAEIRDGVLRIRLVKSEKTMARQIKVDVGAAEHGSPSSI